MKGETEQRGRHRRIIADQVGDELAEDPGAFGWPLPLGVCRRVEENEGNAEQRKCKTLARQTRRACARHSGTL